MNITFPKEQSSFGLTGRAGALLPAALDGASSAVSLSLRLMAGYLFFCGLMEIMKELRLPEKMARLLRPFLRLVMPTLKGEDAFEKTGVSYCKFGRI